MQILAGRTETRALSLVLAAGLFWSGVEGFLQAPAASAASEQPQKPADADQAAATSKAGAAAAAAPGTTKPAAADPAASPTSAALDYLYNRKPQDGSAGQQAAGITRHMETKAKAAEALGLGKQQDPQAQEGFEKYLGAAEVPATELNRYSATIGQTMALLRDGKAFDAWKVLHQAASFETIDAGVSRELANRIEAIWNTGRATQRTEANNQNLQRQIKESNRNADLMSKSVRDEEIKMRRRETEGRNGQTAPKTNSGGEGGAQSVAGLEGKLELTEQYLKSLEAKARIKLNELKLEKLLDTSKGDFESYISTLFGSRRHLHVIVAADFYRKIFSEGAYPVAMANQVNAALEIQRAVASAVEVFRYKVQRNEIAGATERLREAFATNEFHPAVLGLERSAKEKVAEFTSNLGKLQNLIEARDFNSLEALLKETKALASDFDTAKALALVNGVKLESKLRLGKAKLAAQTGDLKAAMEEFQAAAEAWPGNPDLQDKALTFFETQDVKTQSLTDFDRLFAEANYRGIFEKQLAFAPAMKDDLKRQEQLKSALEKIKNAELASEKAGALLINGDPFGAWEAVELASKDFPEDGKLNRLRADLSGRSAEFVSAINKARDAEARHESGFSLTWYVNAQRQYPASRIANEAIDRLAKQMLGGAKAAGL
jgi:hypothetical protein